MNFTNTILSKSSQTALAVATAAMLLAGTGCATKKNLRAAIAPVEARVGDVEKKSSQNSTDIDGLEKQASNINELATAADREAKAASSAAREADQKAVAANSRADSAHNRADSAYTMAEKVSSDTRRSLDSMYENLDNYQLLKSESVQFAFSKDELSKDAKATLDAFVEQFKDSKHYIIEVQGFTDKAGSGSYNLELSRRRAAAVVRYLTLTHNVPLRRIQMLGAGAEVPVADNKTRTGRQQNRRVEVKVFALPESKATVASR